MVGKSPASLPHQNLWKVQVCQLVAARFSNQPPHYPLSTGDTSLEVAAFPRVPCLFCGPNAYRFVPVPMDWTSQFALTWGCVKVVSSQAAGQLISTMDTPTKAYQNWVVLYIWWMELADLSNPNEASIEWWCRKGSAHISPKKMLKW
jgi:hypothetical protein